MAQLDSIMPGVLEPIGNRWQETLFHICLPSSPPLPGPPHQAAFQTSGYSPYSLQVRNDSLIFFLLPNFSRTPLPPPSTVSPLLPPDSWVSAMGKVVLGDLCLPTALYCSLLKTKTQQVVTVINF